MSWSLASHSEGSVGVILHQEVCLTGQGPCLANLHKWGLAQSPYCDCGQGQTVNRIVDTCPLTKFEGGVNVLHEADDDAVIWQGCKLLRLQCSTREIIINRRFADYQEIQDKSRCTL